MNKKIHKNNVFPNKFLSRLFSPDYRRFSPESCRFSPEFKSVKSAKICRWTIWRLWKLIFRVRVISAGTMCLQVAGPCVVVVPASPGLLVVVENLRGILTRFIVHPTPILQICASNNIIIWTIYFLNIYIMLHDKDYASRNAALCSTHISITSLEVTLPFLEGNNALSQRLCKCHFAT